MDMYYKLSDDTWDQKEYNSINEVIKSNRFTMGDKVKEFENLFSNMFNVKYSVMVNSGSSANLLMIAALIYSKRLNKDDEVIVPAVSWSTTYSPLSLFGLKLKFVDIDLNTLNIDLESLKQAITKETKMIFAVNLLGNSNEFDEIIKLCKQHNIILIEDNCESMGGTFNNIKLGTIGLMGSFSTFYSHHICTMEGGVVVTNDEELYNYMLSIRAHGWTRNLPEDNLIYKKNKDNFYESFNFIMPGFNLRPLELEAAIGIEQLKKLDKILEQRRENAKYFKDKMRCINGILTQKEIGNSSWFGFSIVLREFCKRDKIVNNFKKADIEVRPIVAGNFTKNKAIDYMNYEIYGDLKNANLIHDNGFFVGNHSNNIKDEIDYFTENLLKSLR